MVFWGQKIMSERSDVDERDAGAAEPSRSAHKRAAREIRKLIGQIADLGEQSFNAMKLPEDVRQAVQIARGMGHRSDERRRQLQYAAKLQRAYPEFDLKQEYERLSASIRTDPEAVRLEKLRDELISGGTSSLNAFCALVRDTDRNMLRSLVKKAREEHLKTADTQQPRPCARALFRFVKSELSRSGATLGGDFFSGKTHQENQEN